MREKRVPPWFWPHSQASADDVLIIGAGLAGSWLAYELKRLSVSVTVLDSGPCAATGASGNPAGVVKPFVTRAPSPPGDFYREAFAHLTDRLQLPGPAGPTLAEAAGFDQCGVLQLTESPYPRHSDWHVLTPLQADNMAGTRVGSHGIAFPAGGWLNPAALCQALLDCAGPTLHFNARVKSLQRDEATACWKVHCADDRQFTAQHVVLANGVAINEFPMTRQIPIVPARGQLSRFRRANGINSLKCVVSGRHYAMPDGDSVIAGATFQRHEESCEPREHDDRCNREGCLDLLPELDLGPVSLNSHTGVRATTPDRFPLAGPLPDLAECQRLYADLRSGGPRHSLARMPVISGLSIIGGFGSRGIVSAPWTACSLALQIVGKPLELTENQESHFRRMLANRFLIRDLMRWNAD